jgi:hypothetical protein
LGGGFLLRRKISCKDLHVQFLKDGLTVRRKSSIKSFACWETALQTAAGAEKSRHGQLVAPAALAIVAPLTGR